MNRPAIIGLLAPLILSAVPAATGPGIGSSPAIQPATCKPSRTVLQAIATPVRGLTSQQVTNATAIINAGTELHVTGRGQTIAVMTALQGSSLGAPTARQSQGTGKPGLFGAVTDKSEASQDATAAAQTLYQALTKVKGWQNMPPTLAAHAAEHNLNPDAYTRWWPQAGRVVDALTTGSGAAGMANLAATAQTVADCEAATLKGKFAVSGGYVGPLAPASLDARALDLAKNGGNGWLDRCQNFVAVLDGRPHSGYSTALDAWQTFEASGVAHLVTSSDGVSPPVGAWLYYRDSTNPAGHVVTYLGRGQIASTDVFARGRVGIGPASAITDGPWRMQYLGWAPPWGRA